MNVALRPVTDDSIVCPFPFFDEDNSSKGDFWYKIYNDGGHYIASSIKRTRTAGKRTNYGKNEMDLMFDSLYENASKQGLKKGDLFDFIKTGILRLFNDFSKLNEYITDKIKKKANNLLHRKKRFRRKAYLNKWTHFVTITYDDKKQTEESFRKKLRKCLSNLHTRRKWRYMGVFERAPLTGRLHFHALCYIPDGEMIGKIAEVKDYSERLGQMQVTHSNDFFLETFGKNDFEQLSELDMKSGRTITYITKYLEKTNERIVYSRGIATEICKKLTEEDIATQMIDYADKYVLFDDVLTWERDVMKFTYKQLTFTDLICNPPQLA